jgi:DNA-binding winged helix-turn-helix (wHTH) protein/tetratricopeptide (TPR) repeat protein
MRFRFGIFELDEQTGELRRSGEPVRIQPKPFALLSLLIRERDRVVSTDELLASLWPDTVVSPASLNRAVSHARRAIGDSGRGELVKSMARRGYRFMGDAVELDVERSDAPSASPADRAVSDASAKMTASTPSSGRARIDARQFVGRAHALERLGAARDAVLAGETRIVVVSGRAGIGKTRLSEVFCDEATRHGFFVAIGRCREREGMPAFWLWSQILRALVEDRSFRDAIADRAASGEIEALVPGLRDSVPEVLEEVEDAPEGRIDLSSEQQRFLFFDAARKALSACAKLRPIVLVLEDIQWADSGSLRMLEHIALEFGGAPLLILATVRDEPRERGNLVDRTVALLRQQTRADSVELGGLTRREVGEFLSAAIGEGANAPVDLISELYARTEGIPFFVGEATRLLEERGDLSHPERIPLHGVTLPARAVDLIRRATDGISTDCADLLGAGAVLGREFSMSAATFVAGTDREKALDLVDEAIRSGILEESAEAVASYRFSHALFQEAIYDDLTPGARARLHRIAAQRLEQQHAGALDPVLSEIAYHHHHSIAVGDPERAFDFAMRAARQAERLLAWEQAAQHYEQAVASFEHFEAVDPARRVEALLALGEAHRLSGNRARRIAAFRQAVEVARALDAPKTFAQAAIGLCDVSEWSARVPENTNEILAEALDGIGTSEPVALARLTTRLGYLQVRDHETAKPYVRRGAELARNSGDPVALQESLYILLYILAGPDYLAERAELIDELCHAAEKCSNRDAAIIAILDVACDGLMEGDLAKARRCRDLADEVAGRHASPTMVWHMRLWDSGVAMLQGRFAEAEQGIHEALHLGQRLAHPFARACFRGQISILDRDRGREGSVLEQLGGTLGNAKLGATHWSTAVVARAALALGDRDRARSLFEVLASENFDDLARTIRWNGSIAEIAMLAAELEAVDAARELSRLLETAPDQHGLLPMPINYSGPLARPMGALSSLLGLADDALADYERAFEAAAALDARPTMARIRLEAAPVVARAGDTKRARSMLTECLAIASEISMDRVQADASALLERY